MRKYTIIESRNITRWFCRNTNKKNIISKT